MTEINFSKVYKNGPFVVTINRIVIAKNSIFLNDFSGLMHQTKPGLAEMQLDVFLTTFDMVTTPCNVFEPETMYDELDMQIAEGIRNHMAESAW